MSIARQLAEIKGSDTVSGDSFGHSVAISGTTAIVGSYDHASDAGRAYVFTKTATGWKQVAELKGSDTVSGDRFGGSVAISGATAVVGAYGHATDAGRAYIFTKTTAGWKQAAELKGSDTVFGNIFGAAVAISGTTAVVGASERAGGAGRAYIFTKTTTGWKQVAELKGSDAVAGDQFGTSVAISGTTAAIGSPNHASFGGRAYIFTETGTGWKQVAELKGTDTAPDDLFGLSVAVSGGTAVIGAYNHDSNAGRAYIFTKTGTDWKQVAELKGSDTVSGDRFGGSVALSGTTAVIGAFLRSGGAGRVYRFTDSAAGWKQVAELKGSDTVSGDWFGYSVAISRTTAIVGGPIHAGGGRAYVFGVS